MEGDLNGLWGIKVSKMPGADEDKTLGRAQDPRSNGAWLSKLTE